MHSGAPLKHAILTDMFGQGAFDWNEQADASEAFHLILKKFHEHFKREQQKCECKLHAACQLTLCKRIICRWPNCQGVKNEQLDSDVFQQLCYMRPWFEFVEQQDKNIQVKAGYRYQKNYLTEIKLVRGQFFQVFKMISKDLSAVKCPKECGQ